MSWTATFWVKKECEVSTSSERLLMILIADISGDDGFGCYQGLDSLVADSKIEKTTLMRVIKRLEAAGELIVSRHVLPGRPKKGEVDKKQNFYALVMGRDWAEVRDAFGEYLSDGRGVDLSMRKLSDPPECIVREYREKKGVEMPPFDPNRKGGILPPFTDRKGAPRTRPLPGQKGAERARPGRAQVLSKDTYINSLSEVNNAGGREPSGDNLADAEPPEPWERSPEVRQGISELRRKMHSGESVRSGDQAASSGDAPVGSVAGVG